jgi:hypothetical protein
MTFYFLEDGGDLSCTLKSLKSKVSAVVIYTVKKINKWKNSAYFYKPSNLILSLLTEMELHQFPLCICNLRATRVESRSHKDGVVRLQLKPFQNFLSTG